MFFEHIYTHWLCKYIMHIAHDITHILWTHLHSLIVSFILAFLYVCVCEFVLGFDAYTSYRVSRNISQMTIICGITSTSTFTCGEWILVTTTLWRNTSTIRCCDRTIACLLMRSNKLCCLMQCIFEYISKIGNMHGNQVHKNKIPHEKIFK